MADACPLYNSWKTSIYCSLRSVCVLETSPLRATVPREDDGQGVRHQRW